MVHIQKKKKDPRKKNKNQKGRFIGIYKIYKNDWGSGREWEYWCPGSQVKKVFQGGRMVNHMKATDGSSVRTER